MVIPGILDQHKDIGFTGTQRGMTFEQKVAVYRLLRLPEYEFGKCRHGDCIGADADFHELCLQVPRQVIIHPPTDPKKRAYCLARHPTYRAFVSQTDAAEYMQRNLDIVKQSRILIATPGEVQEQLRSGTWATVRYARRCIPVTIVYPDGSILYDKKP